MSVELAPPMTRAEGDAFLTERATQPDCFTLASGLHFKVIRRGPGLKACDAAKDEPCKMWHVGTLPDGVRFDTAAAWGAAATRPSAVSSSCAVIHHPYPKNST